MGYSWWRNVVLSLLGQVGSVRCSVFLIESQFGGVLGRVSSNVGFDLSQYCCVFRRILAGIGFQGGVRFFSLVSGHIASRFTLVLNPRIFVDDKSDILGCVFHDSSIRLSCDVRFGSNIDLNCSGLVLSNISSMVC